MHAKTNACLTVNQFITRTLKTKKEDRHIATPVNEPVDCKHCLKDLNAHSPGGDRPVEKQRNVGIENE